MRLDQLQHVIAVAENNSLNSAARKLYLSQSALSVSIQGLEAEVGFKIFQRSSRGMVLTEEGTELYQIALKVQKELEQIPQIAARASCTPQISMHAAPAFCSAVMFQLLKLLQDTAPEIKLNVREIHRDAAVDSLLYSDASFSVGVCMEDEKEALDRAAAQNQITLEPLVHDRLVAFLPQKNPLSYEESVTLAQLEDAGICMLQQKNKTADLTHLGGGEYYCFSERDSVLKGVSKNMGYAILPGLMAIDNIYVGTGLVKAVPLSDGTVPSTLYLAYSSARPLTSYEQIVHEKLISICNRIQEEVNKYSAKANVPEKKGHFGILY